MCKCFSFEIIVRETSFVAKNIFFRFVIVTFTKGYCTCYLLGYIFLDHPLYSLSFWPQLFVLLLVYYLSCSFFFLLPMHILYNGWIPGWFWRPKLCVSQFNEIGGGSVQSVRLKGVEPIFCQDFLLDKSRLVVCRAVLKQFFSI